MMPGWEAFGALAAKLSICGTVLVSFLGTLLVVGAMGMVWS